jgi:hypothetical protein
LQLHGSPELERRLERRFKASSFYVDSDLSPEDSLTVAAHAKVKSRADGLSIPMPAMQAIREAASAQAQAENARWSVKRAEAAALNTKRWKQISEDTFLGASPRLQMGNRMFVEGLMAKQFPKPPLYLPPTVVSAPRLLDSPVPYIPPLQFADV